MLTDPELDILECEVKWVLGSITMNKASSGDEISAELFQILKYDAVKKCCSQYTNRFGKLSSGHRKRSIFTLIPKKENAKNVQITVQLHSFYMLAK